MCGLKANSCIFAVIRMGSKMCVCGLCVIRLLFVWVLKPSGSLGVFCDVICIGFKRPGVLLAVICIGFKRYHLMTHANNSNIMRTPLKPMLIAASPCESL